MMPWIREQAHHLLAAATWELLIDDKRDETRLGKRGKTRQASGGVRAKSRNRPAEGIEGV
jgi:hypothetical protein